MQEISLFLKVGDGNEADKAVFGQIAREFKKPVDFDSLIVGDSALYSKENLKLMREMRWLSRVPFSIKEAQELVDSISEKAQGVTEQLKSLLYKAHSR